MKRLVFNIFISITLLARIADAAEQTFFYLTDPAGTPLAMTNSSGAVVWKADYKPFGEENTVTATASNDRRFVGKEKDEETGLSYFGARYENAKIGRFIAPDPVRTVDAHTNKTNEKMLLNPQKLNTYAYGLNNPYRYVDPDGRDVFLVARGLDIYGGNVGVHSFLMLIPDNPKDFQGMQFWTIGGYAENGKLVTEVNNSTDTHWNKWKGDLKGIYDIPSPKGKSDTEFINDIMTSFNKYKSGSRNYEAFPELNQNEGNCNNISSGALVGAGISPKTLRGLNPSGFNPQLGNPLPEMIKKR